jgi:hypothetical protein
MTDEEFPSSLESLKDHAAERSAQSFRAGDRKAFDLWDSRLAHLKYVNGFEDMQRAIDEIDLNLAKLKSRGAR